MSKGFDKESLRILKRKKNLRIIDITNFKYKNQMSIKSFSGSFLIQDRNNRIVKMRNFKCITKLKPSKKEFAEIEFAFNVSKFVKSNAIVLCNNFYYWYREWAAK